MDHHRTECLKPDADGVARAVALWQAGGLVAFPTETVYGLGADATNGQAVAAIYAAKGRPSFNPLIVHVANRALAMEFAEMSSTACALADVFWPGPLSLVLPVRPGCGLSSLVTAGLSTVAIRVPDHPLAAQLLGAFGGAIAAPSANPSGRISPTSAAHVLDGLEGRIDAVIDGGPSGVGLESTIVLPDGPAPALLRPGGLPAEAIEAALGQPLIRQTDSDAPLSPGQLLSHYAPEASLTLNVTERPEDALWLGFGPGSAGADMTLSAAGDLHEAAANLFAMLRRLDELAAGRAIAVAPVPQLGLGAAINDRLRRAAAPRS